MQKIYYSPKELAELWGISENTLRKWRWEGKGPRFVKLGARVAYRKADIEHYSQSNLHESTTTIGAADHHALGPA